jgi:hypothetical protein
VIGIAKAVPLATCHSDVVFKIAKPETVGDEVCCYRASSQAGIRTWGGTMNDARTPKENVPFLKRRRIHFWSLPSTPFGPSSRSEARPTPRRCIGTFRKGTVLRLTRLSAT